jgi:predicted TIM-barrel fold metal-dependent hydrolase
MHDVVVQDSGAEQLERLVRDEGFRAVRFNPYLWPEGEKMTNARGRAMYERAGKLGVPVGHMPFKGLLRHIDEIETLLTDYPSTSAVIDHMGFCKAADPDSEEWRRLLGLARFPQVYVKVCLDFTI